jgi:hypothetical protein
MMGRDVAPHHRFASIHLVHSPCSTMDSPAVRAPDFPDTLDWIHTGGQRLSLADFRGRVLLLDFWTYG